MKKIFVLLLLSATAAFYGSQSQAQITADKCLSGCAVSMAVNTGHTSIDCPGSPSTCSCTLAAFPGCTSVATSTTKCPLVTIWLDNTATGLWCCGRGGSTCMRGAKNAQVVDIESTSNDSNLGAVFDDSRTTQYFGVVDNASRSPNYGRAVSIDARLDACLGYGVVDTYVTSYTGCISACNDSTKNGFCTATVTNNTVADANGVCHDRCECKYGMGGTCDNL